MYAAECRCVHLDTLPLAVELQAAVAAVFRGRDVQVIGRRTSLPLLVVKHKTGLEMMHILFFDFPSLVTRIITGTGCWYKLIQ